jgi:hypothetical protein
MILVLFDLTSTILRKAISVVTSNSAARLKVAS